MSFLKKNWSNLVFIVLIILLIIPQTRKPLQIAVNRLVAFSPSEIAEDKREKLQDYHWEFLDMQDRRTNLQFSAGEVAIVNIWATWCPPCIAEMPSFQKLYDEYGERVDFYFVSAEEKKKLESFVSKHEYQLPVLRPLSLPPEQLESKTLPTTFVLSKEGEIVVEKRGAANWNDRDFKDLLESLLRE